MDPNATNAATTDQSADAPTETVAAAGRENRGKTGPKPINPAPAPEPPPNTSAFDLADNDLQRVLVGWKEKLAGYTGILVAAAVVLAIGLGYWLISSSRTRATQEEAWQRLATAEVPEQYAAVAQAYPGSEAAVWARLSEARANQSEGIRLMFTDRADATQRLEAARDTATAIADDPQAPFQAREQAALMRAVAIESLSGSDVQPAIDAYEAYLRQYAGGTQARLAQQRIDALKEPETAAFYAWFNQQNPTPPKPPEPNDGLDAAPQPPPADVSADPADTPATDTPGTDTPGTETSVTDDADASAVEEVPADGDASDAASTDDEE